MQISKEAMEQYEKIRSMGPCNMFDIACVKRIADNLGLFELASLTREEYVYILSNFSTLMKKHDVKQD